MDSPSSYYTAPSSPAYPMAIGSAADSQAREPNYRPARQVSKEIAIHAHVYFDEKLYTSALNLVTALANSGTSHPNALTIPALAPLPIHIEAVSILLVHPQYTTQAPQSERAEIASRSISFLRSLLSNLGPLNANLAEAFSLTPPRSRARRRYGGDDTSSDDDEEETAKLKGIIMNKGRIRACVSDFWHIVGWAFNCSVVHRKRWKFWKVWLDYMLDVLDADWDEREAQDKAIQEAEKSFKMRKGCLLVRYLSDAKGGSRALERVVGSIFVNGGSADLKAYPEIFANETLEVKAQNGQERKREDEFGHKFGDYNDEEDDLEFDSGSPGPSQETDDGNGDSAPNPWMGGPESIALRQRVLVLLSRVAYHVSDQFVDCVTLYDIYCDNMKLLPLPAFSLMIAPSKLPSNVFVSLSQIIILRLIPNHAPRPWTLRQRDKDDLSQEILEKCFLPFSANTSSTDDNAKLSILVESILRLLFKVTKFHHTKSLDAAIETGILARENKCQNDKRKKEEADGRMWLIASGNRLRSMLAWVKEQNNYSDED